MSAEAPTPEERAVVDRAQRVVAREEELADPHEGSMLLIQLDSHGKVQLHRLVGELLLERWPSSVPARRLREEREALEREAEEAAKLKREQVQWEAKLKREQVEREAKLKRAQAE